jgi:hypothetical protein
MFGMREEIMKSLYLLVAGAFVSGLIFGLPLTVTASENSFENLTLCSNKKTGILRYIDGSKCKKRELKILVGVEGRPGPIGPSGPAGAPGPAGIAPIKLVQSNGEDIPWKLLTFSNSDRNEFLLKVSESGVVQTIELKPGWNSYLPDFKVLYEDNNCFKPKFVLSYGDDLLSIKRLISERASTMRTNAGWAYISDLKASVVNDLPNYFQLSQNSDFSLTCNQVGVEEGQSFELFEISGTIKLPELKFPLKWVQND